MSFLLPQTRDARLDAVTPVEIHGDRYLDVRLVFDDPAIPSVGARLGASDCPDALVAGERVRARIVMGVVTRLERA